MKIKVFILDGCKYCEQLIKLLENDKIEHVVIDAGTEDGYKEFTPTHELTKSDSFPTIVIGEQILVPEISFRTINGAFNIIKLLINQKIK